MLLKSPAFYEMRFSVEINLFVFFIGRARNPVNEYNFDDGYTSKDINYHELCVGRL